MIDLHAHILPGLDDGAVDLAESLLMGEKLAELGFTRVVATPHLRLESGQEPGLHGARGVRGAGSGGGAGGELGALGEEIRRRTLVLNEALQDKGIALEIVPGAELMFRPRLVEALEQQGFFPTLGESRYLLLELSLYQPLPPRFQEDLFLLQTRGYRPVLAHPERNLCFLQNPGLLYELARQGLLFQLTLASLTGHLGSDSRRLALALVQQGQATFAGTDAHHHEEDGRLAQVPRALEVLAQEVGEGQRELFTGGNARRALAGEHLEQVDVSPEMLETAGGRRSRSGSSSWSGSRSGSWRAAAPGFFRKILQRKNKKR